MGNGVGGFEGNREFKELLKRFIDGTRWLHRGQGTQKDKDDFMKRVVEPMDAMWAQFTRQEKRDWWKAWVVATMFNGRIM